MCIVIARNCPCGPCGEDNGSGDDDDDDGDNEDADDDNGGDGVGVSVRVCVSCVSACMYRTSMRKPKHLSSECLEEG